MSLEDLQGIGNYGRGSAMSDRWKILYSEQNRSPTNSVQHYISYLRKHVADTGYARKAAASSITSNGSRTRPKTLGCTRESINPMSYFLRKLKLDLKLAYANFVTDFIQAPNNGLRLLLALLKNLQILSSKSVGSLPRSEGRGTPGMDDYKRSMIDEQDCLLCIKYTLRIPNSTEELLEDNSGLLNVATCLLSNYSGSRVTALEILTLLITGPSSVDKILEAFTSLRLQYGESTRFKMLTSMMQTRGATHVLFQVTCLHLLNNLLNMCRSSNMRVFLQYELEEAGLNLDSIQKNVQGDGLEFDDLHKEIREWKTRYIDVDSLLRKIKSDMKKEFRSEGLSEYYFDQKYGNKSNGFLPNNDLSWVTTNGNGYMIDYDKWMHYVQTKQKEHDTPKRQMGEVFLRRDVYIPDSQKPQKTLSSQSQLTDDKIPSPTHLSSGKYKFGHHDENEETSLYDVISVSTSVCESEHAPMNADDQLDHISRNQRGNTGLASKTMENMPSFIRPKQNPEQTNVTKQNENDNWSLKRMADLQSKSIPLDANHRNTFYSSEEDEQDIIDRHDSGVSINYRDPDSQGRSGTRSSLNKPEPYSHFFYTGSNPDKQSYQESVYTSSNTALPSESSKNHVFGNSQSQLRQHRPVSRPPSDNKSNDQNQRLMRNRSPAFEPGHKQEINSPAQRNGSKTCSNIRPRPSSLNRIRTPSPDYNRDVNSKVIHPKLPASKPVSYHVRPTDQQPHQKSSREKTGGKPAQSSYPLSNTGYSRFQTTPYFKSTQNNLSPKTNSNILKQNGFNQVNQNSSFSTDTDKQSVFEDKVIPNGNSSNDSEGENRNPATPKRQNGNLIRESKDIPEKVINDTTEDNGEVYTNEVDKILQGLDQTLEQHGWKDSIKSVHSTKVPFVAYI